MKRLKMNHRRRRPTTDKFWNDKETSFEKSQISALILVLIPSVATLFLCHFLIFSLKSCKQLKIDQIIILNFILCLECFIFLNSIPHVYSFTLWFIV